MNDKIEAALERWREYDSSHGGIVAYETAFEWDTCLAKCLHTEDHCVGWAHRELLRRGYAIYTQDRGGARTVAVYEDHGNGWKHKFAGPTLLDCYLDVIEATDGRGLEDKAEPNDGSVRLGDVAMGVPFLRHFPESSIGVDALYVRSTLSVAQGETHIKPWIKPGPSRLAKTSDRVWLVDTECKLKK